MHGDFRRAHAYRSKALLRNYHNLGQSRFKPRSIVLQRVLRKQSMYVNPNQEFKTNMHFTGISYGWPMVSLQKRRH
jgi:hypothetical protein